LEEKLGPIVLSGKHVRLEPMAQAHAGALLEAGKELDWEWMPLRLSTKEAMVRFISEALAAQEKGHVLPFTVFSQNDGSVIGSTRYMDIQPSNKGVEIGWTWYARKVWGTSVNPESKYLLLKRAFEDWKAIRVQLKTDSNNVHSQRAIIKLGALFEGKLRNHMIRLDGTYRDSMMYSIIKSEWPGVKKKLLQRIV
jgi:N-acetyltransferase